MQQDVRTVHGFGFHAVCSVTGITVQSFQKAVSVFPVPDDVFRQQLKVSEMFNPAAVKIGALFSVRQLYDVIDFIRDCPVPVIIDPVFRPTAGNSFYSPEMISLFRREVLPHADVITPNKTELEILFEKQFSSIEEAAEYVLKNKPQLTSFILKGGHFEGTEIKEAAVDGSIHYFFKPRRNFQYSHGTGCMLSTAIACGLADGMLLTDAFCQATEMVSREYLKADFQ